MYTAEIGIPVCMYTAEIGIPVCMYTAEIGIPVCMYTAEISILKIDISEQIIFIVAENKELRRFGSRAFVSHK